MENDEPTSKSTSRGCEAPVASFSVIALHDGYQAEMLVNRAFAWLHQSFRDELRMSFNSWTFEKLVAALDIRAMSLRIGTEADMIIIANSSGEPLPDHVKRWLDAVSWQPRDDRAMVVAFAADDPASSHHTGTLCDYLQQWAARWHAANICCADLHQPSGRQSILRLINQRFHRTLNAGAQVSYPEPDASAPLTLHQTMNKIQTTMTPEQIQEVRGLAYHLWLQADRPAGKEIDFWLSAEQQIIQAAAEKTAAEKTARETSLNAAPTAKSATRKIKPTSKRSR